MSSSNNTSRRVTRGRQRIPLARIENDAHRNVTFSKRRTGLFKKASEMSTLCGTEIAMVVFSPSGKAFTFSNPDLNTVLTKYFVQNPTTEANIPELLVRYHREANKNAQINILEAQIDEEMLINQALREAERGRPSISSLQLPELQSMKYQMETLYSQCFAGEKDLAAIHHRKRRTKVAAAHQTEGGKPETEEKPETEHAPGGFAEPPAPPPATAWSRRTPHAATSSIGGLPVAGRRNRGDCTHVGPAERRYWQSVSHHRLRQRTITPPEAIAVASRSRKKRVITVRAPLIAVHYRAGETEEAELLPLLDSVATP
nr:agamous-like MADS-box protein AGL61 [Ipomoea trifida]